MSAEGSIEAIEAGLEMEAATIARLGFSVIHETYALSPEELAEDNTPALDQACEDVADEAMLIGDYRLSPEVRESFMAGMQLGLIIGKHLAKERATGIVT